MTETIKQFLIDHCIGIATLLFMVWMYTKHRNGSLYEITEDTLLPPLKQFSYDDPELKQMPCCYEYFKRPWYNRMLYLPRNPRLDYRANGDVNCDFESRETGFVAYNNAREAIRQAKMKGFDHIHWVVSSATEKELRKDGYIVDHHTMGGLIRWEKTVKKYTSDGVCIGSRLQQ